MTRAELITHLRALVEIYDPESGNSQVDALLKEAYNAIATRSTSGAKPRTPKQPKRREFITRDCKGCGEETTSKIQVCTSCKEKRLALRYKTAAAMLESGLKLRDIAARFDVSLERARQMAEKGWHEFFRFIHRDGNGSGLPSSSLRWKADRRASA